jgi:hypothetical protein
MNFGNTKLQGSFLSSNHLDNHSKAVGLVVDRDMYNDIGCSFILPDNLPENILEP